MAGETTEFTRTLHNEPGIGSLLTHELPTDLDSNDIDTDIDIDDNPRVERGNNMVPPSQDVMDAEQAARAERGRISEQNAKRALLGRQTVGMLVAAAVSDDETRIGGMMERYIDQVRDHTGPLDIVKPETQIKVIKTAAELAREVQEVAHDEAIEILKARIAELEANASADIVELKAELEQTKRINTVLVGSLNAKNATIRDYELEKAERQLREQQLQAAETRAEAAATPVPLRQRIMLGARSALAYFTSPEIYEA